MKGEPMEDESKDMKNIQRLAAGRRLAKSDHPDYFRDELVRVGIPYPANRDQWFDLLDLCGFSRSLIYAILKEMGYPGPGKRLAKTGCYWRNFAALFASFRGS